MSQSNEQNPAVPSRNKIVLIQGSLFPDSKTAKIMEIIEHSLKHRNIETQTIDLRKINMEFNDGRRIEQYNSDMQNVYKLLKEAQAYVIGMPVYRYSMSGPLKNFLEIVGEAMSNKFAGLLLVSEKVKSYLAANELMKIMSYELNITTVPPIVHVHEDVFDGNGMLLPNIKEKIEIMIQRLIAFINAAS